MALRDGSCQFDYLRKALVTILVRGAGNNLFCHGRNQVGLNLRHPVNLRRDCQIAQGLAGSGIIPTCTNNLVERLFDLQYFVEQQALAYDDVLRLLHAVGQEMMLVRVGNVVRFAISCGR